MSTTQKRVILFTVTSSQEIMTSWRILKFMLLKTFNFDDITKIFTNTMKVIYSGMKSQTVIVSTPFWKLFTNTAPV